MMLALHGRPSDTDAFQFILAHDLGRTVAEISAMPHAEYVQWAAFYAARDAIRQARS